MNIVLHWPQITWIILVSLSLIIVALNHGKPRESYNIFTFLITLAISVTLLIKGGFFG